eukprot:UN4225
MGQALLPQARHEVWLQRLRSLRVPGVRHSGVGRLDLNLWVRLSSGRSPGMRVCVHTPAHVILVRSRLSS